jgi:group I intron endonuclease
MGKHMASGIYRLTFKSGKYYVGKSLDLETRWKQHFNKFATGKAARPMQLEYDQHGLPKTEVLLYCHRDHIDILEEWLIDQFKGPNMLNTTYPDITRTADIATLIDKSQDLLSKSTWEHLEMIHDKNEVTDAEKLKARIAIDLVKSYRDRGRIIDEDYIEMVDLAQKYHDIAVQTTETNEEAIEKLKSANQELYRLKNLSWFDRLFTYRVNV